MPYFCLSALVFPMCAIIWYAILNSLKCRISVWYINTSCPVYYKSTINWPVIPRKIPDGGDRRSWIKFSPSTNKFPRKISDLSNLKLEMEYAMKIETQLVMKLKMNNDTASWLENSMGIETSWLLLTCKTNFTHESDGWKYGIMWSKICYHCYHHPRTTPIDNRVFAISRFFFPGFFSFFFSFFSQREFPCDFSFFESSIFCQG